MRTEYEWAKMTDAKTGLTCNVLETESGYFYDFGEPFTAKRVPDDALVLPDYWNMSKAQWAAGEMLVRKLNEIARKEWQN